MVSPPLISIILPVYNGADFLSIGIESCLRQTYSHFELIIIDDGSTDESYEIAKGFEKDNRVKIIRNSKNEKLPKSLNTGHKASKGKYITWTSHDNILKENFLTVLFKGLSENEADIVFSNYDIIRKDGSLKRRHITGPVEFLLTGNQIGASFLYKKEVFDLVGGFNPKLFMAEDYDFWLRAMCRFKFIHLNVNPYCYRIHEKSLTAKIHNENISKKNFEGAVQKMFVNLGQELSWNPETIKLILALQAENPRCISLYLRNRKKVDANLKRLASGYLDYTFIKLGIFKKFRLLLRQKPREHKKVIIAWMLLKERGILFNKYFNYKESLSIIYYLMSHGGKQNKAENSDLAGGL